MLSGCDGHYQRGVELSYTRDGIKEVVVDSAIGLMWQDNESVQKQWVTQVNYNAGNYSDTSGDTATTYCSNLELGSYADWRLPTRSELFSIVDQGEHFPAINLVFQNTASSGYWSSTTYASSTNGAWVVGFHVGGVYADVKGGSYYVRCVRPGE